MTINIRVSSYRRVDHIDLECSPIALAISANGHGKTSLSEAVQAALTGITLLDRLDLNKKDAGQVLNGAAKAAYVSLRSAEGEAKIEWPECKFSTSGSAPHASIFAAGVTSIDRLKPGDRAAALAPYLKAEPNLDDLTREMRDNFKPDSIAAIWKEITEKGWDTCHKTYEENRRNASRRWSDITGVTWGSDKASRWLPEGWKTDLEDVSTEDAEAAVAAAETALEEAVSTAAVDQAELIPLRGLAAQVAELKKTVAAATTTLTAASADAETAKSVRAGLLEPVRGAGKPCPHSDCKKPILVQPDGTLEVFAALSPDENKKRGNAIASADGAVSRTAAAVVTAKAALGLAEHNLHVAEQAQQELAEAEKRTGGGADVPAARDLLIQRKFELDIITKYDRAFQQLREWSRCDLLVKVLDPAGLRHKKLGQAVEAFNRAVLAPLSESAGWREVTLTEDLVPRYAECPYTLLSGGHLYRMRAVLQIAMAKIDGSTMVVFDAADILDSDGRRGLFEMITESGLYALVTMTTVRGAGFPDLADLGCGTTVEIHNGRVKAAQSEQEAA